MPPTPAFEAVQRLDEYERRAERIAHRIAEEWMLDGRGGLKELADAVVAALVADAGNEVVQVITQLSTQIEIVRLRDRDGAATIKTDEIDSALAALERLHALVMSHLNVHGAIKHAILLEPQPFDLADALARELLSRGVWAQGGATIIRLQRAPVVADLQKLVPALGHLVAYATSIASPNQVVRCELEVTDGKVIGFIGVQPAEGAEIEIITGLDAPIGLVDDRLDLPYVRAVVERHGGRMYVGTREPGAVGLVFELPVREA